MLPRVPTTANLKVTAVYVKRSRQLCEGPVLGPGASSREPRSHMRPCPPVSDFNNYHPQVQAALVGRDCAALSRAAEFCQPRAYF